MSSMPMPTAGDSCFVNTNLLLYAFDPADAVKHKVARQCCTIPCS